MSIVACNLDRPPAWVDGGVPIFRGDIYGHDAKLLAALDGKAIAW